MQSAEERGTSDDLSHYFLCAPTQSQSAAGDEGETSRAKSDKTLPTDGRNPSALWKIPADADFYLPLCVKSQAPKSRTVDSDDNLGVLKILAVLTLQRSAKREVCGLMPSVPALCFACRNKFHQTTNLPFCRSL